MHQATQSFFVPTVFWVRACLCVKLCIYSSVAWISWVFLYTPTWIAVCLSGINKVMSVTGAGPWSGWCSFCKVEKHQQQKLSFNARLWPSFFVQILEILMLWKPSCKTCHKTEGGATWIWRWYNTKQVVLIRERCPKEREWGCSWNNSTLL